MTIEHFDDLLRMARAQAEPQRLLFVFAGAELAADASAEQRAAFDAGEGGELAPLMCVHKAPEEVGDFDALTAEAAEAGPPWALVFTAALSGKGGQAPSARDTDAALQRMVNALKGGRLDGLLPFDRAGTPVMLA